VRHLHVNPSPRAPAFNIARVAALEGEGRITDAGRAAFATRRENRSGVYSFEQRSIDPPPAYAALLRAVRAAWAERRLAQPIECSASGARLPQVVKDG